MRNPVSLVSVLAISMALAACGQKQDSGAEAPEAATSVSAEAGKVAADEPAPAGAAAVDPDMALKQAQLDDATMEDAYINDPKGQWASAATASSSYGDVPADSQESYSAWQATGVVNGDNWSSKASSIGFDWLQTTYATPVKATEVRVVFQVGYGVEAVSKVELKDTDGAYHTVWSGVGDVADETRGERTWFVKKFPPTPYKVAAVKVTVANALATRYKYIDAVQLIGE